MQFFLNGCVAGCAYALVGLSFSLIYTPSRFFHFAHGCVYTVAAYVTFLGLKELGLPLPVAALTGLIGTAGLGMAVEKAVYRPLRRKGAKPIVLLLASLGVYIVFQNLISLLFGDDVKSIRNGDIVEGFDICGARISAIQVAIVLVSCGCFVIVFAALRFTRWGQLQRAVASDAQLATIHGINNNGVILSVSALGSALAGLAAILAAMDVDMTPTMGLNALMMGVVGMIIGGIGSVTGTFLGGLLLGLAQNLGIWRVGSEWQDAIAFGVLVTFLLIRPQGIFGRSVRMAAV